MDGGEMVFFDFHGRAMHGFTSLAVITRVLLEQEFSVDVPNGLIELFHARIYELSPLGRAQVCDFYDLSKYLNVKR
jgi:hypothetical protein